MIPAISSESHERSIYTAFGTFTGSIGYNGIAIVVVPIVTTFSFMFTGLRAESQSGWTAFAIVTALLGILIAWTVALGTKENESTLRSKTDQSGNPLQAFAAIAQNEQLLWMALSYLLYAVANVAANGVMFYLFKFVLGLPDAFAIAGVIPVIVGLVMTPLYPALNRRVPCRCLFCGVMVLMALGYVLFIFDSTSLPVVIVAPVLFYLPAAFIQMTAILSLADSTEYGQLKTGKCNEAVALSVRPMLDKIAGALSNSIVGFVAVTAGMVGSAAAADMTAANVRTFETFAFYIPLAFIVLSLLVFMFTVKIDENMHAKIVAELEEKLGMDEVDG